MRVTHEAIPETGVPETGFDSFWPAILPTLRPSLSVSGLIFSSLLGLYNLFLILSLKNLQAGVPGKRVYNPIKQCSGM